MLAAVILSVGIVAIASVFSTALRSGRIEEERLRDAFRLEAGIWQWEKTGEWLAETDLCHEESREKSMQRGTLSIRPGMGSDGEGLSLTAYR
jgi:hypothetical protein